jgi:hypothetical protein
MRLSLKKILVPSIPLAILLVAGCVAVWFSAYFGGRFSTLPTQDSFFLTNNQSFFQPNSLLSNIISITFVFFNAFLLGQINNRFTIIRTRTFLPIFIFLILMASWNETHAAIGSHLALTFIIIALFYFFSMFRNKKASEQAFMGSFFIGIGSLLIHPFIFLIPVCWIGFEIFQSFSLRTFLASILGTLAPWLLYLSTIYLLHNEINFSTVFNFDFNFSFNFSNFTLPEIIYSVVLFIIMLISLSGMFSISKGDAIYTRNILNFILLLLISLFVLILIFRSQSALFLPVIALIYAILFSHPLTLKKSNFYVIIFLIFCLLNIAFVISKYIQI